ncbi:MAB_1171c family putative transporter [Kutzneria buriramensis]|uniref:DUF6545 domain-containing protein n=1 Tax=Kutzneria buriramensis TaxID=1045776 RepID=A0A3E0HGP1_9PSEU|nr:MAB_1171c family putative transporter [Kutzneria buriramensis]REH44904.1 hypothetical protein BCF44_108385 [Kutzneria buriramensis]
MTFGFIGMVLCATAIVLYKLPALVKAPKEGRRTLLPLCLGAGCTAFSFVLHVPSVADGLDAALGVPNTSTLVIYTLALGMLACAQVMVANWVLPWDKARRRTIRVLCGLAIILALLWAIFATTPRLPQSHHFYVDFATNPHIATLLVFFNLTYLAGALSFAFRSFHGATVVPRDKVWLRWALVLCGTAPVFMALATVLILMSIVGAWYRVDLTFWGGVVAPVVTMLGMPGFIVAVSIAQWGPRIPSLHQRIAGGVAGIVAFHRLRPLWRMLRPIEPAAVHPHRGLRDRFSTRRRLRWRMVEISDWMWRLNRYRDPALAAAVERRGRASGLSDRAIAAAQEAAHLTVALAAWTARTSPPTDPVPTPVSTFETFDIDDERQWLVAVAAALSSPVVTAAVTEEALV